MVENFFPIAGLLVLIIVFGVWVSRTGKPYNGILFNIHKLLALGAVVLTAVRLFRLDPFGNFPTQMLTVLGLAVLGVVALFTTGAMMSIQEEVKPFIQWVHGMSTVLCVGSIAAALLLW